MNKRKSIYVGNSLEKILTELSTEETKVSSIINAIADKYAIVVEQHKPPLTREEFLSMCAAYNGHFFGPDMLYEIRAMSWQAAEWIKYNQEEAGQFDTSELVSKIEKLSVAERVSLLHQIALFWSGNHPDHQATT